ncbi:MurR/RpiR family transcriptional regulator [Olsenella sp. HMSC062G07]|uniref:MurR/RpiR family transcriptional regulator n=1 Tax=Olsenella sp. HMSC062G07 TaxID=1739330 RepID=UPI0008A50C40|nr:MurR/RpiR family transcriptional regulator [Olsenella sp. HMSC062G07]OFK23249.1 hypothetical protein HMPREF2826_05575 [Olsenella sp. HMSC062G07]
MVEWRSAIDKVLAHYESLSETERKVADFIVQHTADVTRLSVREIAQGSGTSSASVSRFVRHIGFESFSDLRLAIASEQTGTAAETGENVSEVSMDNIEASVSYVLENRIQELAGTAARLKEAQICQVVNLIMESDTILFAAVGNSIPVCSNFSFKLGQIGIRAHCPATTEEMILSSLSLRRSDLLFVVSASGYSRRLETIVDNAEDSGTPIVFLTSNPGSELAQRSNVQLTSVTRDQILTGGQFSTHMAEDFLVETIFIFLLTTWKSARGLARLEQKSLGRDKESTPTLC